MLLLFGLLFIALLVFIFYMIFKDERFALKHLLPKARIEGSWSGNERRKFRRFSHELTVTYMVLKKALSKNGRGKTVDISEGGVKVLLDKKLDPRTSLNMKIDVPETGETAEVIGEVMWTEDAPDAKDPSGRRFFYSGIRFSFIKEPAGKSLINYVRSLGNS